MTENDRMAGFLRSLLEDTPEDLASLRKEAEHMGVPIIRPETEALLSFFLHEKHPKTVLEIGTGIGYSTVVLARESNAKITTIESYEPRYQKAEEVFRAFHLEDSVTLFKGDADIFLGCRKSDSAETDAAIGEEKKFDFIFLDAAKAQYIHWLPVLKKHLNDGGLFVADNVLQEGEILESRFLVRRRDRTIHERMRDFLFAVMHDEDLETVILPVGDGVTVSRKGRRCQ